MPKALAPTSSSSSRSATRGPSRRWDTRRSPSARSGQYRDCHTCGWSIERNELPRVLNIYKKLSKRRAIGVSPLLATEKKNQGDVRMNLELNRKEGHKYPPIQKGDRVRVYKKKQLGEKESVPPWTKETWKVTNVDTKKKGRAQGVPIMQVDTSAKPLPAKKNYLMRHEVFKVPA